MNAFSVRALPAALSCALVAGVMPAQAQVAERRDIIVQDYYADGAVQLDYLAEGFTNDVVVLGGGIMMADSGSTIEDFIAIIDPSTAAAEIAQLDTNLQSFANNNGLNGIESTTTTLLIIDIEIPYEPHEFLAHGCEAVYNPGSMTYDGALDKDDDPAALYPFMRDALIARIDRVRNKFPNAVLGLYGIPTPHGHGTETGFERRRKALQSLTYDGAFDEIDVWVPLLYQRFGWNDVGETTLYSRLEAMTTQALEEALALNDWTTNDKDIYPLLGFEIYNGGSSHHETQTRPDLLARQVEMIRCFLDDEGLPIQWGIWVGVDDEGGAIGAAEPGDMGYSGPTIMTRTIYEFMDEITCRADLDGDGVYTTDDSTIFSDWVSNGDVRADFDGSGGGYMAADTVAFITAQSGDTTGCGSLSCP